MSREKPAVVVFGDRGTLEVTIHPELPGMDLSFYDFRREDYVHVLPTASAEDLYLLKRKNEELLPAVENAEAEICKKLMEKAEEWAEGHGGIPAPLPLLKLVRPEEDGPASPASRRTGRKAGGKGKGR